MTETATNVSPPPDLTYGYVDGRIILAIGDRSDAGRMPDPIPAEGLTVTLTPANTILKVTSPTPATVIKQPIVCDVDANGYLVDGQGARGVWLVAGVYKVTYSHPRAMIPSHDIDVTTGHTEAAPLDLTTAMPPGGPVLAPSEYAELNGRITILEAGGGGGGVPTWSTISGKPAVVAEGATQADARTAIGAGTSNLAIGTTGTTAAAGNRAATETATGMVELATTTEATTGTDTTRAVTPAGLKAVADTKAATSHTHTASQVSDSTATGRSLLTATDAAAARTALGLGTAATTAATAYATAVQGAAADAALSTAAAPELIRDTMATALVAGTNVTITPNDGADTITIAASGGGGGGGGVVPPEPLIIPPGVGQYLPVLAYGGHFGFSCVSGRSYPCPQYAHEAMNVDAVGVTVEPGVSGATIELALYTWGGGITSTLVSTLGSVDASSAGLKVLTFTPLSLVAGLHLIVARPSATVSVWGVSGGTMVQDGSPDAGTNRFRFPHHAAASLPSSITWDYDAGVAGNNFPKFQMRRSA